MESKRVTYRSKSHSKKKPEKASTSNKQNNKNQDVKGDK